MCRCGDGAATEGGRAAGESGTTGTGARDGWGKSGEVAKESGAEGERDFGLAAAGGASRGDRGAAVSVRS